MKLHRQFLRLHARYGEAASADTTLEEIGQLLECTSRNATNIIGAMSRNGWISWEASRGRGRRSSLRFLVQPEEIAVQSMMQAINRKDVTQAIDQMRTYKGSSALQEHLQGWLLTYFGHHTETFSDRQIDMLRLPIRQPLHTADPLYMNFLAEAFVSSNVFDGLVRRTERRDEILPAIAHAWETDGSRTKWTFYLRKEVLFHHGKVLTADDVVFSFERLIRSSRRTLYNFIYKQIASVRALNPTTVRFELEEPNELFLPFLCTSRAAIVPKDLNQLGTLRFGTSPLGTGPFKVTEMNEGLCALEVFSPHFQGRAHLDRVEIVHVPWEAESAGSAGEQLSPFHVMHDSAASARTWSRIHSDTTVRKFITCNTQKAGPLTDPTVRAHLFSCLSESGSRKPRASSRVRQPRDDRQSDMPLRIATIPPYKSEADALAAKLATYGYACEVASVPPEEFKGPIRLASDLILFSSYRDQDEQLRRFDLYMTISEHVDAHARIDIEIALQRVRKEPDPSARTFELDKIERLLTKEHLLFVLSEKPVPTAYLPSVRGVTFNSQGWVNLRTIWFPPPGSTD
ncbi:ABC transporter substrate-binding protein [Cohnella endophytica]|uniref:ABC transporter substrate-binding protein n=1 Tax=Cohnella endophytica TaxID=2419778 RepID=A0A494XM05_9BACL|nr:ABC transporter substrate-binding protein [Cohnella endophytica]RKP51648.1 ABC transporter substrate-binding protein [Cohnella endophytica]